MRGGAKIGACVGSMSSSGWLWAALACPFFVQGKGTCLSMPGLTQMNMRYNQRYYVRKYKKRLVRNMNNQTFLTF